MIAPTTPGSRHVRHTDPIFTTTMPIVTVGAALPAASSPRCERLLKKAPAVKSPGLAVLDGLDVSEEL
jgi:hypothetical protein